MGTDHLAEAKRALDGLREVPHDPTLAVAWASAQALVAIAESLAVQTRLLDFQANGPGA